MAGLNLFTNNAATTLASSILVGATSLTVAASTGGLFPNPTSGQYFYCTLQNTTGTVIEIVKVTARSTDTFTIVRAQDNTTASAFAAGDKVELRATAADLNNFGQLDSTNTWALAQTFTSPIAATSGGTAQSTYTTGDIIYASASNTLSKLPIGTTGQALTVSGGVPAWAAAGGSTSLTTTSFTATAGQTSFTVSYTPSLVQGVYRNGVKLDPADYTASSGTAIVLAAAAALNDNIQVQYFTALSTLATPLAVSLGGTGNTSATAYALLAGGTTTTGAFQSIASVGTTGQVLTSNGASALPTFQAAGGSSFPTGTRMSFQQTAAPTGWTKDTTAAINDSILRLVTGSVTPSGGSTAFSTWNAQTATGATTLSTAQIPSHTHSITLLSGDSTLGVGAYYGMPFSSTSTGATGGGGSHTHSLTQSLKYYDFIIASKD